MSTYSIANNILLYERISLHRQYKSNCIGMLMYTVAGDLYYRTLTSYRLFPADCVNDEKNSRVHRKIPTIFIHIFLVLHKLPKGFEGYYLNCRMVQSPLKTVTFTWNGFLSRSTNSSSLTSNFSLYIWTLCRAFWACGCFK